MKTKKDVVIKPDEYLSSVEGNGLKLLYLTSYWTYELDHILLNYLEGILNQITISKSVATIQLPVLLTFQMERFSSDTISSDNTHYENYCTKILPNGDFVAICKYLQVTSLPACVLFDAKKEPVNPSVHSIEDLQSLLYPTSQTVSTATQTCVSKLWQLLDCSNKSSLIFDRILLDALFPPLEPSASDCVDQRTRANEQFERGEIVPSAQAFYYVLLRAPTCTKSHFNLAVILQMAGDAYFAIEHMIQVVTLDPNDSIAHSVLRSVLFTQEPTRVLDAYKVVVQKDPENIRAIHSLATLEGNASTVAPEYVRQVFDELADTFEDKLVNHLEYKVPWQLIDEIKKHTSDLIHPVQRKQEYLPKKKTTVVLDLGCGTGLCGRLLAPYDTFLIGIDLSPLMIEKTKATNIYHQLHATDILPFLRTQCTNESIDLILSADVWIYVGELEEIFMLCASRLKKKGWFAFSIELLYVEEEQAKEKALFKLAMSGRFQHTHRYIEQLACENNLRIHYQEDIQVRKESGEPIPGRIYLLQRL